MVAWPEWEPVYGEILREFGYSREADESARDELASLLAPRPDVPLERLRRLFEGRDALVVGPAPGPVPAAEGRVVVAADAAARRALDAGLLPDVVVTDLDGALDAQLEASRLGALVVAHAHGDNRAALAAWVPRFEGPVVGTTQAAPVPRVHDFGGFTDGDRAVLLADHFGARDILLSGFDFERPVAKPGRSADAKARKLAWARRLIGARARLAAAPR